MKIMKEYELSMNRMGFQDIGQVIKEYWTHNMAVMEMFGGW